MRELVEYQVSDRIASITMNRPEKRNALNPELVALLHRAFQSAADDESVKVIILKARGEVFSAGADLEYLRKLQDNSEKENIDDTKALKDLFLAIYTCPKFVIAQVEGHAIAGGCGLASVCDVIFSVPEAKFGYTEVKIGFIPAIVTCFLVRKLGEGRARELLLGAELVGAETASQYGLVNFVVAKEMIDAEVLNYARKLSVSVSANSVRLTKELINYSQNHSLEDALEEAVRLNVQTRSSADCKHGISSFLNRQNPEW